MTLDLSDDKKHMILRKSEKARKLKECACGDGTIYPDESGECMIISTDPWDLMIHGWPPSWLRVYENEDDGRFYV